MVRDGIYYAAAALVVAVLLVFFTTPWLSLLPLLSGMFCLWFFRDPERSIPAVAGAIVSPGDGKVTDIVPFLAGGRNQTRISIFLNVFDEHVNRSPIAGTIKYIEYRQGKFGNALAGESAEFNEQNVVTVEGEGQTVTFKQIAGLIARRIVFTKKQGDVVARGERVGLIKFGSRVDVIFDSQIAPQVKLGDRVRGGSTILAVAPVSEGGMGATGSAPVPVATPVSGGK